MAEYMATDDPHAFTKPFQLVKTMRRQLYPAVDPTRPELSQRGKIVVVTGAGGGIGYRTVEAFALAGAAGIVLVGRSKKSLEAAAAVAKHVPTLVVPTDLSDPRAVEAMFVKTKEHFGLIDVVAHVAGMGSQGATIKDSDPEAYWELISVNVRGTYNVNHFFARATDGHGTIINVSSNAAAMTMPGLSAYSMGKWAQIRLTEALHMEEPELRVFSLHPGIVAVEEGRGMLPGEYATWGQDDPKLSAGVMVYLASPLSEHLRGTFISACWDVDEMEKHKDEIADKKLTQLGFLNAQLGPEGHPFAV